MTLRRLEVRLLINTRQRGAKGGERRRGEVARGQDRGREGRGGEGEKEERGTGESGRWRVKLNGWRKEGESEENLYLLKGNNGK